MKLMYILDKIKRFPNQDLALYLMIVSIFLPFYLFLSLFLFYFILLIFTGKIRGFGQGGTGTGRFRSTERDALRVSLSYCAQIRDRAEYDDV